MVAYSSQSALADQLIEDTAAPPESRSHLELVEWVPPATAPLVESASTVVGRRDRRKRVVDVVTASVLLVVTAPLTLVAMAAIRLSSRGPALFRQVRIGRNGEAFTMLKLRSMTVGCSDEEHRAYTASLIRGQAATHDGVFKLTRDTRVTGVGRVLRRFSIDELPQLWNVVRGDMSLVGPRPALPHEVALYDAHARLRLQARPGITGLWQVSGRCRLTFREMVDLDLEYIRTHDVLGDLRILVKTPLAALAGDGAA